MGPSTDDAYTASYPKPVKRKLSSPLSAPGQWAFETVGAKGVRRVEVTHKYWFAARKIAAMLAECCPGDLRLVLSPFMGAR